MHYDTMYSCNEAGVDGGVCDGFVVVHHLTHNQDVDFFFSSEIFPNRVRGKATALATSANWAFNFVS